jgi:hypothetical protein
MLDEIPDLPPGVIGFEVSGRLEADDYRTTLAPALEAAAAVGDVRLVVVIPAFDGLSAGAMWEDTKIGVEHWGGWKRTAVVTDIDWMANALAWFGWMSPGEIKHFALAERDAAIAWAAG